MRRTTERRTLFELARKAEMPVYQFLEHVGDRSLGEMGFRVAIAADLKLPLGDLDEMPARELDDWFLLYDVEQEAAEQSQINQSRRT